MTQKKIKIMFITPWLKTGGAERMLVDVMGGLDKNRYDVSLLLFDANVNEEEIWLPALQAAAVEIIRVHEPKRLPFKFVGGAWRILRLFIIIKKEITKKEPDIVQTQLMGDYFGRLAAYVSGVPVIISVEQNVNVGERWHVYMMNRLTTPLLTCHVAISKAIQNFIIKRYHSSLAKTTVIYSGINVEKFLQPRLVSRPDKEIITFGAIGRLTEQKGFSVLISALQKIKATNYQCLIAGEGPLRQSLQTQIDQAGLSDRIKLIGIQKDIRSFLAGLDFFVMPSIWEGLGLVALEAGLAGLPVIATKVDGLQEIVDEKTGILIPPNDPEILAKRISYYLEQWHSPEIQALGQALQEKVKTNFSLEKTIREYDELYQDLLTKKKSV